MKVLKTSNPLHGFAWVALGLLAVYSVFGVFTTVSMRPIDPIIRLSPLYYPRRFVPTLPWNVEDHLVNTMVFGLPVLLKMIAGALKR